MLEELSRAAFEADIACLDPAAAKKWDWKIVSSDYPYFDVIFNHKTATPLRLRLECRQWDEQPPSIELLHADGSQVTAAPPNVGSVFHPSPHPVTGKHFVCMRGTREYHTHFSHVQDFWSNYRGKPGNDLIGIVAQLYRAWKKAVR